jgi:hypothetical protein
MKLIRNLSLGVLLMWVVNGCFNAPDYPTSPQIQFLDDRKYFSKETGDGLDELVVALKFQDGDGDIGIDDSFTDSKYVQQYFFSISTSGVISPSTLEQSNVNYKFSRQNPQYKLPIYDCKSWELKKNKDGATIDTIYTELNDNFFNLFVDYYIKNNNSPTDTSYTKFDIYKDLSRGCPDRAILGGRIPVLSKDPGKKAPLDGIINFSIRSFGLEPTFGSSIIKLRLRIQDRAFNKSNLVESSPFTLQSIRR